MVRDMREEVYLYLLIFMQSVLLGTFATLFRLLIHEIKRFEYLFNIRQYPYKVPFGYL